jgi:hypothetical protein
MQRGQGVIWVPARGILETAVFPPKATFDSSRTPKRGEIRRDRSLKPLDLSKLKDRLASIEEETKANDPKALKAEIARLSRELTKAARSASGEPDPDAIRQAESAAYSRGKIDGYAEGVKVGAGAHAELLKRLAPIKALIADLESDAPKIEAWVDRKPSGLRSAERADAAPRQSRAPTAGLTGPQQRLLDALAWWKALGFEAVTRTQLAFVAAYKPNTGTFNTYLGQLSTAGLISYPNKGHVALTGEGAAIASAPTDGVSLHDRVKAILTGPQVRLLDPLLARNPGSMSRAELAQAAEYQPNTGTFNTYLGQLSTLGLITYPERGHVRAADWLFPEPRQ